MPKSGSISLNRGSTPRRHRFPTTARHPLNCDLMVAELRLELHAEERRLCRPFDPGPSRCRGRGQVGHRCRQLRYRRWLTVGGGDLELGDVQEASRRFLHRRRCPERYATSQHRETFPGWITKGQQRPCACRLSPLADMPPPEGLPLLTSPRFANGCRIFSAMDHGFRRCESASKLSPPGHKWQRNKSPARCASLALAEHVEPQRQYGAEPAACASDRCHHPQDLRDEAGWSGSTLPIISQQAQHHQHLNRKRDLEHRWRMQPDQFVIHDGPNVAYRKHRPEALSRRRSPCRRVSPGRDRCGRSG